MTRAPKARAPLLEEYPVKHTRRESILLQPAMRSTGRATSYLSVSRGSALLVTWGMLTCAIALTHTPEAAAHGASSRVRVQAGWLQGTRDGDGLERYLGVPYAEPPTGTRRWHPPEAIAPWKGVKTAIQLPPRCAQVGSEGPGSEDCLYVNVFKPIVSPAKRLPVLVYLHGGSLRVGSAWDNDPSRIARETETIVVMVNYRLGMLGFLNHPRLDEETADGVSGNYGLMDQQAAIQWVHDEIGNFGGDPKRVTIAGASAGGTSVCAHLVSDPVAGLFSRAVIQSGQCFSRDAETAGSVGSTFADALGCPDAVNTLDCLRSKTQAEILAIDGWNYEAAPVHGGALLPDPPAERIAAGDFTKVPVVYGFTENELRTSAAAFFPMTMADYEASLIRDFGVHAEAVRTLYPVEDYDDPYYAIIDALDDSGLLGATGCGHLKVANQFAAHVPTYVYLFDDQTAPNPAWLTAAPGFVAGASHGADEPYWFDRPQDSLPPFSSAQKDLAAQMVAYLGQFVERGGPALHHAPRWPRYDATRQTLLRFSPGETRAFRGFAERNHCAFWDSLEF